VQQGRHHPFSISKIGQHSMRPRSQQLVRRMPPSRHTNRPSAMSEGRMHIMRRITDNPLMPPKGTASPKHSSSANSVDTPRMQMSTPHATSFGLDWPVRQPTPPEDMLATSADSEVTTPSFTPLFNRPH